MSWHGFWPMPAWARWSSSSSCSSPSTVLILKFVAKWWGRGGGADALPEAGGAGAERGREVRAGEVVAAAQDGPGARATRPDRAAGGRRAEQHGDRARARDRQAHGRPVAR